MASIVRSQPLHRFPLSGLKWSINLTTTTRLGSQAADSNLESPIGDSGVRQIESESDDRRLWTHCSSLQAARNGVENPTVVIDPAIANKTADSSEGSKLLIRFRSKEKSSVVEEAEKQPPPQARAQARSVVASEQEESTSRVWNLRSRKPRHKISAGNSAIEGSFGVPHDDSTATLRKCTDVIGEVKEEKKKKKKRAKFSIALSKEEIEADFMLFTGAKPPRRPKKRPRTVQKQIDYIFPGLCLPSAVTPQMYDVSLPLP